MARNLSFISSFTLGSILNTLLSVLTGVTGQLYELTYTIEEELRENTVVGQVGRDSNISQLLSAEDYASLNYRLLVFTGAHTSLFTIGNTSGVLRTANRIDRETMCHFDAVCRLNLHVAAQTESGQQFFTFKIYVVVKDINDHYPQFPVPAITVTIDEDAAEFTSIPISAATDPDILNYTIQTYSLKPPSDTFELKVSRNLDDSLVPQLYVKAPLNREARPYYILKVVASDGGSPKRTGELTVNVTLNDVNDNPPRFSQQTYDIFVDEITPIGSKVMPLTATDDDIGPNGRVRFRLGARQSEEAFQTFRVVPETGVIVTTRDLTPLQGETMRLVVEAIDDGVKPLIAQAVVNIHIVDSINNAPAIRMTIPSGQQTSRIMENASPGFVVAHFIVEDADSGENGVVACHLQDDTFGLQRLKEAEYKVTVYSVLDREHKASYAMTITCIDGGSPPMTSSVDFFVTLEDANDNPPRFQKSVYRVNVTENNEDRFVLKLEAEDIDQGQNAKVVYRLGNVTSLVSSYIHVNATTGEMRTKQTLDRELFRELDFFVVAADEGKPSLSSTVRVIIDVIDVNDNGPKVPVGYFLSVKENEPIGTFVGHVNAIDPDTGPAGKIGYTLLTDIAAYKLFTLSETGEVRTLVIFDREIRDAYDISVLARDYGSPPETNILHIRIMVTDDNDHAPVIEFPRTSNKTVHTTVDLRFNATVTNIVASDMDLGDNAALTYEMMITNTANKVFDVDPKTGRVYTTRNMYPKDKGTYEILLKVADNGVQPRNDTGRLVIVVAQGNATAAYFSFSHEHQVIIVTILVGVTVLIAIAVFLIVLRFLKKDRRDRRPKYTGGLPMEVKKKSPGGGPEEDASSDEGPWRRYDEAKRPKGPVVTSGDVSYDANDDIIMFKLKLADQYKELEPEDKDRHGGAHSDGSSNRNSVTSDVDGAPDGTRDRNMGRLNTFQAKQTMLQVSGFSSDSKDKVWRTVPKEKMADEILSSSSRETTGADSGRGPSEDGSQSRSSITDESGCLISPSHSILRGTTPKLQGSYSRPPSGSSYDRPPLLMTFQTSSPDSTASGAFGSNGGGQSSYGTRKDYPTYSSSPSPKQFGGNGKEYSKTGERRKAGEKDAIPKNVSDSGLSRYKETTVKKTVDDGYGTNSSTSSSYKPHKSYSQKNGGVRGGDRPVNPSGKGRDSRLCSEPPHTANGSKGIPSPSYNTPVQETGLTPTPSPVSPSMMYANSTRPLMPASADGHRTGHSQFKYPPSPSYLQTTPGQSINTFKQASCPQLYKNTSPSDHHVQPAANRSKSFNVHESVHALPSRTVQEALNESFEGPDDGNTTTTSGSYTIDHDELSVDLPQTDVFV